MSELNDFLIRLIQTGSLNSSMMRKIVKDPETNIQLLNTILANLEKYEQLIRIVESPCGCFIGKKQKEIE